MPTSMNSSLRLLFVLLLSCAVCLHAQQLNNFLTYNSTLPLNGDVFVLPTPINITSHPGPLVVTLRANYSVSMCVTPNAAVTSNLAANCPPNSYFFFDYINNKSISQIAMFLDDFSMNFRGQYEEQQTGSEPNTNITTSFRLLQNLNYYMSLSFAPDNLPPNSTYADFIVYLFEDATICSVQTIPSNIDDTCVPVTAFLNYNFTTYNIINLSARNPALISFTIQNLTGLVQIELTGILDASVEGLVLDIAYNAHPTAENSQYHLSTIQKSSFITPVTSQIFNLTSPLVGTYYAQITSTSFESRDISFTYYPNEATCTIPSGSEGTCGPFSYDILGSEVDTVDLNSTWTYYAVTDVSNLQIGVQLTDEVNGTFNGTFQVLIGNNYFPSINTLKTGIGMLYQDVNGTFYGNFTNPQNENSNYFIAVSGTPGKQAIIWQGAECPENCNEHGQCVNFQCECDSDYSGDYCENHSSSKLSTLYIILIIIGGAIVLAVLIGVPVALYLNNRKRARYERV